VLPESPVLRSTASGAGLLDAVRSLTGLAARKVTVNPMTVNEIDDTLIPPMWRQAVFENPSYPEVLLTATPTSCACSSSYTRRCTFVTPSRGRPPVG
jgi:hypothetical protein